MRNRKEWVAVLNGKRIDHNGIIPLMHLLRQEKKNKRALCLLAKAKMYYFNTYRLRDEVKRNTRIFCN
jgi:hypothetical protein